MLWVIIERVVHLITLVILIIMLAVIFQNSKIRSDGNSFIQRLEDYKAENEGTRSRNIELIERRNSILQEQQNAYQITVDKRLSVMENTIKKYVEMDNNKK